MMHGAVLSALKGGCCSPLAEYKAFSPCQQPAATMCYLLYAVDGAIVLLGPFQSLNAVLAFVLAALVLQAAGILAPWHWWLILNTCKKDTAEGLARSVLCWQQQLCEQQPGMSEQQAATAVFSKLQERLCAIEVWMGWVASQGFKFQLHGAAWTGGGSTAAEPTCLQATGTPFFPGEVHALALPAVRGGRQGAASSSPPLPDGQAVRLNLAEQAPEQDPGQRCFIMFQDVLVPLTMAAFPQLAASLPDASYPSAAAMDEALQLIKVEVAPHERLHPLPGSMAELGPAPQLWQQVQDAVPWRLGHQPGTSGKGMDKLVCSLAFDATLFLEVGAPASAYTATRASADNVFSGKQHAALSFLLPQLAPYAAVHTPFRGTIVDSNVSIEWEPKMLALHTFAYLWEQQSEVVPAAAAAYNRWQQAANRASSLLAHSSAKKRQLEACLSRLEGDRQTWQQNLGRLLPLMEPRTARAFQRRAPPPDLKVQQLLNEFRQLKLSAELAECAAAEAEEEAVEAQRAAQAALQTPPAVVLQRAEALVRQRLLPDGSPFPLDAAVPNVLGLNYKNTVVVDLFLQHQLLPAVLRQLTSTMLVACSALGHGTVLQHLLGGAGGQGGILRAALASPPGLLSALEAYAQQHNLPAVLCLLNAESFEAMLTAAAAVEQSLTSAPLFHTLLDLNYTSAPAYVAARGATGALIHLLYDLYGDRYRTIISPNEASPHGVEIHRQDGTVLKVIVRAAVTNIQCGVEVRMRQFLPHPLGAFDLLAARVRSAGSETWLMCPASDLQDRRIFIGPGARTVTSVMRLEDFSFDHEDPAAKANLQLATYRRSGKLVRRLQVRFLMC
ncbi:30S ribosomal S9 [Chlorella sorokiniana]|uniref:30S ribosomal S9 n=1 Tax=Chlorella sorokiniana TaxID=3076 RepID=A0A2P6TMC3_CHLSO|nr:30S ribosomal S9 [Chlorella sorokiniana]|eukprot:PRW45486.1 30S ribosomal S9 [Chlorella sorokiniana]